MLLPVRFFGVNGCGVSEASIAVERKSMGHTVANGSSNEADLLCIFLCISCICMAVMEKSWDACGDGYTIGGRVFRRQRVPMIQRHRMPLTRSRWDLRWLIGRRTKPTFSEFSVFCMAINERSCDACGDREDYFRSGFSASEGAGVSEASNAVDRKSIEHTVGDRSSNEADFQWIFRLFFAWRLSKRVLTFAVTGNTICDRVFRVGGCRGFGGIDCR